MKNNKNFESQMKVKKTVKQHDDYKKVNEEIQH